MLQKWLNEVLATGETQSFSKYLRLGLQVPQVRSLGKVRLTLSILFFDEGWFQMRRIAHVERELEQGPTLYISWYIYIYIYTSVSLKVKYLSGFCDSEDVGSHSKSLGYATFSAKKIADVRAARLRLWGTQRRELWETKGKKEKEATDPKGKITTKSEGDSDTALSILWLRTCLVTRRKAKGKTLSHGRGK